MATSPRSADGYVRRVFIAVGIVVLVVALAALVWYAFSVLLVIFAGILFGVLLDGLAQALAGRTPLGRKAALGVVLVLVVAALGVFIWLVGPHVIRQATALQETIPTSIAEVQDWLGQYAWGQALLQQLPPIRQLIPSGGELASQVTGAFSTVFGVAANLLIIAFIAVYGALNPSLYVENGLRLVPRSRRARAREVVSELAHALRSWLKGRFAAMAAVGVLVTAGLSILGVPLALTLGLLAGLLDFVPFLGPIAATVPGVLVALLEGGNTVLYVLGLYGVVQLLENYLITPLIQQRVVSMPPALLIAGQVLFGVFGGLAGVIFATPLLVCVIVLVQMLYVEDRLGEDVTVMGE